MSAASELCKQRFKGVENFLRKIAFNLGNSPSQTEVKIISCIPIDVTDLQQKIISLEKELDAVKATKPQTVVQTVACSTNAANPLNVYCQSNNVQTAQIEQCEGAYMKHSGSGNSLNVEPSCMHDCTCCTNDITNKTSNQQMETDTQCQEQNIFKKGKIKNALKKKGKGKTHLVYYTQTESGPFVSYQTVKEAENKEVFEGSDIGINHAYINEMVQKQYAAVPISKEFPITDQISSPVCCDVDSGHFNQYDTDICSCLRGPFHNTDNHQTKFVSDKPQVTYGCNMNSNNTDFYDTSLYDMVPVKEKPTKPYTLQETNKRKLLKGDMDETCFLEKNRQRYRLPPFIVNYSQIPELPVIYPKKSPVKGINRKERQVKGFAKREKVMRELEKNQQTIQTCSIDCGDVYIKRSHNHGTDKPPPINPIIPLSHKNAECITHSVKDTECQTTTSQSIQIDDEFTHNDKKTEDTLNQIKVILQTVLTEVKTSSQGKKVTDEKSTKDAVVQKGLSQGMMPGCSSLLHSYTYSPHNMDPYAASCSRPIYPGVVYPNVPYASGKCLHNFPVFIQSPMRNMCSCYRNSSTAKEIKPKHGATTATNTEAKERDKETQKLIKEIYKSVKLNMEIPKDTSTSEYEGVKSTPHHSFEKSFDVGSVRAESIKIFVKSNTDAKNPTNQKAATIIPTLHDKPTSNTMSSQSHAISTTDTEQYLRHNRIENYLEILEAQKLKHNKITEEYEGSSPSVSEDSSEGSEDTAIPMTEPQKKPEKRSLFSKMFKGPFKLFKSKPKKKEEEIQVENETEEDSEGESDDYQTIYSHNEVNRARHHFPYPVRSPIKEKGRYRKPLPRHIRDMNQERQRRSPYLEQEYRRQWDEKLMFHENQHRRSSEDPRSNESDPRKINPKYWRDYQAMSARVNRNRLVDAAVTPSVPFHTMNRGLTLRIPRRSSGPKVKTTPKTIAWLKKHKPACCGQWKKLILEG
ncbi:unnamed protein product [Diatraea saccharalis]|uniref:Uncharacterized protein n=1 Tax=Diatraea saccharalis TaxID=40085 RepID=A0A9N9W7L1_9NEOP|nr:unnamed protein product [Diatraea saccharalis]